MRHARSPLRVLRAAPRHRVVATALALTILSTTLVPVMNAVTPAASAAVAKPSSAGVTWQKEIAGYGITVLNWDYGYAGPKVQNTWHRNIILYTRRPNYIQDLNVHYSRYTQGGSVCFYGWDSVHNWVLFDFCWPSWLNGAGIAAAAGYITAWAVRAGWVLVFALPAAAIA